MSSTTLMPGDVFTGTPEQILTDVIGLFQRQVQTSIRRHLGRRDPQLAEDLAQEVFLRLWRYYIAPGTVLDERLPGLLAILGRQVLCQHYNRRRNHETALDFTDPDQAAARTASGPASEVPHLAVLYDDLETAQTALTVAAERYRAANRVHVNAQRALRQSVRPETITRCTERARAAEAHRSTALEAFREAGERTAQARAAWNGAADEHTRLVVTG